MGIREHKRWNSGVPPYLRLLWALALFAVFPLSPLARAHDCPEFSFAQPEEGPLAALNCDFHHRYEERVAQTQALFGAVGGRPVILSLGGELRLKRNGGTETVDINPPRFDQLKAFSHAPFAVVLAFSQGSPGTLGVELAGKLRVQQAHLEAALAELPQLGLPPEAEVPCRALTVLTRDFIGGILKKGAWTSGDLATYHTRLMPLFLRALDAAAALELPLLDLAVSRWLAEMSREERARLGVVVATAHQARATHRVMQYFERKLGRPTGVGAQREDGLVSLEGATDEASAEALLARHYVDRAAAQVLFADPSRLQRDLLADAAALHLRERLPRATPIDGPAHGVPDQPDVSTQVARVGSRLRLAIPVSNAPSRVQKLGAAGRRGYASIPGRASSPGRRGCRGATGCSCGVSTPSGTPRPPAWSSTSGRKGTARAVGMLGAVATSRCRRAKLSLFVICATTAENCSTRVRAPVGVVSSCPLRIAGMTSIPAIVQRAAQKDLKPSIGRVGVSVLFMKFHTRYDRVAHVE